MAREFATDPSSHSHDVWVQLQGVNGGGITLLFLLFVAFLSSLIVLSVLIFSCADDGKPHTNGGGGCGGGGCGAGCGGG